MKANSIDQVIQYLDKIIKESKNKSSRKGYFAALYRKVTLRVKSGIENGEFQDGKRMEVLDVNFANRYLEVFELNKNGQLKTNSWKIAFDGCERWWPIVLQHLLTGMNAHISLDLGVAAAETMKGKNLSEIRPDFDKINDILVSMINEIQEDLSEVWPMMKYIDKFAGLADERISGFGMVIARGEAWRVAEQIWGLSDEKWDEKINEIDQRVEKNSRFIFNPGWRLVFLLKVIRITERRSVSQVIELLC